MCRVFGVLLQPQPLQTVFFRPLQEGSERSNFVAKSPEDVLASIAKRRQQVSLLATDCAKRSTKAGYDAAGFGVGVIDIEPFLNALPKKKRETEAGEIERMFQSLGSATPDSSWQTEILFSKDGGDFLETHSRLLDRLQLKETHYVYGWTAHIRQASQGDMYSAVNAHPHFDGKQNGRPFFSTMHNGDILDADVYKSFLREQEFEFLSNADSCVIPAIQRFIFDALRLQQSKDLGHTLAGLLARLPQCRSDLAEQLVQLAKAFAANAAQPATIASALTARILECSNLENKFVFQTLSPLGNCSGGVLGGGTLTIARGGFREGGEEGGEAMFYLPYPQDDRHFPSVTAMVGSEENALKDQVPLIDFSSLEELQTITEAKPLVENLPHLQERFPQMRAKTLISEGGLPIFDVHPGEILEISGDGLIHLFDTYTGESINLKRFRDDWKVSQRLSQKSTHDKPVKERQERIARLKRFKVDYRDLDGNPVAPPFNTYGEEIIVVQPKALRDNTAKLFRRNDDGTYDVVPGRKGLGLWMGTDDRADRANTIRHMDFKLVGAAGTSFLIAQIAENLCRKLGLNRIPGAVIEGFTGSDCPPLNVSQNTLFVANSNSGGTSDTIKLTRDLTALPHLARLLVERYQRSPMTAEGEANVQRFQEACRILERGGSEKDLDQEILAHIRDLSPHVFVITNIEASPLGDMGRGLDERIFRPAGTGVTNLPEEECVGSTFAAMASLQWLMALDTYLGEVRGHISRDYARKVNASLVRLPEVCDRMVSDVRLATEIQEFADRCVGGNNDFIYTGYVNGVPEEQAHKFAEMIQTMAVGWHYFMFQHGKYAHVRRASRHALGSVVGHNVPPPSWPFFNARALKAPREIKARAAILFAIAHESNREELLHIPDYRVDYVFSYPEDDIALYPFQAIMISHLISYYWGIELKKISDQIANWNLGFIELLEQIAREQNGDFPSHLREEVNRKATQILLDLSQFYTDSHRFDNAEVRRMNAIFRDLYLLSDTVSPQRRVAVDALMNSPKVSLELKGRLQGSRELNDGERLTILKDLALELSTAQQAKRIADLFLTDASGQVLPQTIAVKDLDGGTRTMSEYDYWCQYEGLGEFYHVNPIHPPKIAKAKKGWL